MEGKKSYPKPVGITVVTIPVTIGTTVTEAKAEAPQPPSPRPQYDLISYFTSFRKVFAKFLAFCKNFFLTNQNSFTQGKMRSGIFGDLYSEVQN